MLSEHDELFKRLLKIHSNPPILCYGFNSLGLVQIPQIPNLNTMSGAVSRYCILSTGWHLMKI